MPAPWDESKHPRGQPENKGEFGPGGGGAKTPSAGGGKVPAASPGIAAAFSTAKGAATDSFVRDAWARLSGGKRLLFSERPGSVEARIQEAFDRGEVKSEADVRMALTPPAIRSKPSQTNSVKLTPSEKAAVEWYSGDGFIDMNASLRGTKNVYGDAPKPESEFKTTIKDLSSAIDRAGKMAKPMSVYRGVRMDNPAEFISKFKKGETISMKGFTSTSIGSREATASGNVVFRIETDRSLPMAGLSKNSHEGEVLLGHNWNYEVVGEAQEMQGKSGWKGHVVHLRVKDSGAKS